MRYTSLLITSTAMLLAEWSAAQKLPDKVYYDGKYNVVKKAAVATYYRTYDRKDKSTGDRPYRDYYIGGELKAEGAYSKVVAYDDSCHFVLDGRQTNYLKNGDVASVVGYKDDKKHGEYAEYGNAGGGLRMKTTGSYSCGKPDGHWETHYMVDGQWVAVGYMDYLDGQLSGGCRRYDGNELVTCSYKNDRLHGLYVSQYVGSPKSLASDIDKLPVLSCGGYFGGKKDLEWKYYTYPGGFGQWTMMKVVNYVKGKAEGVARSYYNMAADTTVKDSLASVCSYANDKREGPYVCYDKLGRIVDNGNFAGGQKSGKWTYMFYDEKVYMVVNHDDHNQPIHFYTLDGSPFTGRHRELRPLSNDMDPDDISITVEGSVARDAVFTNTKTGRFVSMNRNTVMFHAMIYAYLFGER